MRKTDDDLILDEDEVRNARRARIVRTYGGLIIAAGGTIFAFLNPLEYKTAFIIALIGAGIIDISMVWNWISGRGGK